MSHDPNRVLLGGRVSSISDVTCEDGNPALFKAGTAVRRGPDGKLTIVDNGVSPLIGVSMGEALIDPTQTSVMRVGNFVPLLLQDGIASVKIGDITFTAIEPGIDGNTITITLVDSLTGNQAIASVVGKAVSIQIDGGVTTAAVIASAVLASTGVSSLVKATVDPGDGAVVQAAAGLTPLVGGTLYDPPVGSIVKIDDLTGVASATGDNTAAIYVSGRKTGVYPDRTTSPCALINLIGGF